MNLKITDVTIMGQHDSAWYAVSAVVGDRRYHYNTHDGETFKPERDSGGRITIYSNPVDKKPHTYGARSETTRRDGDAEWGKTFLAAVGIRLASGDLIAQFRARMSAERDAAEEKRRAAQAKYYAEQAGENSLAALIAVRDWLGWKDRPASDGRAELSANGKIGVIVFDAIDLATKGAPDGDRS